MAREEFETIGKCGVCHKKDAKIIFKRINFLRSMKLYLCEDCAKEFNLINNVLNRRIG